MTCSLPSPAPRTYTGFFAEPMVERQHCVPDHDDERAASDRGAIDVAWHDADRLTDGRGRVLAGGEDPVDVGDLEPGVAHGVGDGLDVQGELTLPRQGADLVALVHADDADRVAELPHSSEVAPP